LAFLLSQKCALLDYHTKKKRKEKEKEKGSALFACFGYSGVVVVIVLGF